MHPCCEYYLKILIYIYFLRWLDIVFQGQYLPSLSENYVAINKDLVVLDKAENLL